MARPARVAYMLNLFTGGGAARQALELARRIDRDRYLPHFIVGICDGAIGEELLSLDLPLLVMKRRGRLGPSGFVEVIRHLRSWGIDVVHSYMFIANTWARTAGPLAGVPAVICSTRGFELGIPRAYARLDRILALIPDKVIVNAEAVARFSAKERSVPVEKLITIYNGVDCTRFHPDERKGPAVREALNIPVDAPTLGMIASFGTEKRWDVFMQTAAKVAAMKPEIRIICVGEGSLRRSAEEQSRELGLNGNVHFLGNRRDVQDLLSAMDVVVLTSDYEGMPNVVLEAMAAGRPVVATAVGGMPDMVEEGKTGFLVPPGRPDAVAERCLQLLGDTPMRLQIGRCARQAAVDKFSFETCVARTMQVYDEVLAKKSRA